MTLKFNPPPNWPQPPAGWVPPAGWRPDPSWPALPFGWQLWIDDAEQQVQAAAPYGAQPPTVYPPVAPPSPEKSQHKVTRAQGGPKARRSWQASLARLFGVVAGFFLGLFGAGIATGQIDTAPDTLVAFGAFIAIPAVLAVVFSALAVRARKRKQSATGSVAQQDPSPPTAHVTTASAVTPSSGAQTAAAPVPSSPAAACLILLWDTTPWSDLEIDQIVEGKRLELGCPTRLLKSIRVTGPMPDTPSEYVVATALLACREAGIAFDGGRDQISYRGGRHPSGQGLGLITVTTHAEAVDQAQSGLHPVVLATGEIGSGPSAAPGSAQPSAGIQMPGDQTPSGPPSGWYPDPTDASALCWWDGTAWFPATRFFPLTAASQYPTVPGATPEPAPQPVDATQPPVEQVPGSIGQLTGLVATEESPTPSLTVATHPVEPPIESSDQPPVPDAAQEIAAPSMEASEQSVEMPLQASDLLPEPQTVDQRPTALEAEATVGPAAEPPPRATPWSGPDSTPSADGQASQASRAAGQVVAYGVVGDFKTTNAGTSTELPAHGPQLLGVPTAPPRSKRLAVHWRVLAGVGILVVAVVVAGVILVPRFWHGAGVTQAPVSQQPASGGGQPTSPTAPAPAVVASVLTAGFEHTCRLTAAGTVQCWGLNGFGQLGDGTTTDRSTPVNVVGLGEGVTALSANGYHTCALTSGGAVKCWGDNDNGQLGDGTTESRSTPVDVVGLSSGVRALAAGYEHTCAVTTGGAVECWGANESGQLGDGTTTNRTTPIGVQGLTAGVQSVVAGGDFSGGHSCALTTTGAVSCWGNDGSGQLGDGNTVNRSTPVTVTGLASNVRALTAGNEHTCALTTAEAALCWGYNGFGQLGNGTTDAQAAAVAVTGLGSGVQVVSAGGWHTCAVTSGGAVLCWGGNSSGELGDGTNSDRNTPVAVVGLGSGVRVVQAGSEHTCALTAGAEMCWGNNASGQLGNGTTTATRTPTIVG